MRETIQRRSRGFRTAFSRYFCVLRTGDLAACEYRIHGISMVYGRRLEARTKLRGDCQNEALLDQDGYAAEQKRPDPICSTALASTGC